MVKKIIENEISKFYVPSDIFYIAMGATSSLCSPQYGSTATIIVGSITMGIASIASYIHDTDYFAELAVAIAEFSLAANIPHQISLGIVFALGFVNKETVLYYHNLLRESVTDVLTNVPSAIDKYTEAQIAMYNCIPRLYETYFGDNGSTTAAHIVGVSPDELT